MGSTSAVMMMNSQIPRLSVLVASLALSSATAGGGIRSSAPLLELLVVRGLLHEVEDLGSARAGPKSGGDAGTDETYLVGELRVGEREGLGVRGGHAVMRFWGVVRASRMCWASLLDPGPERL